MGRPFPLARLEGMKQLPITETTVYIPSSAGSG